MPAFLGAGFAFIVTMVGATLPTPLYPLYREAFGFSQLMITVIFAVYAFGVMAALIGVGRWSDQLGRRPMLLAGLLASLVSDLLFWQAEGLTAILLARAVSGVSAGIFTGTATVAVLELAPERARRISTFVATAANMGGLGLGSMFSGVVAEAMPHPLATPYLLHLALALMALLAIWFAPETVKRPARIRLGIQRLQVPPQVRAAFVPAAIGAFAGFMVCGFFASVAPAFLGGELGYESHAFTGFVAGLVFIASTFGQLAQSRLPEARRLSIGCLVLFCGVAIIALGLGERSIAALIAGVLVAGFGHGVTFRAGLGAVAAASPPDCRAGVVSTFFVVAYLAISFPVIGVGLLSGGIGLQLASLAFAAIAAFLCLVALALLLRGTGARSQPAS